MIFAWVVALAVLGVLAYFASVIAKRLDADPVYIRTFRYGALACWFASALFATQLL